MKLKFSTYLNDLRLQQPNPQGTAFFDLDRTLIAGYSVAALGWEGFKRATVPRWRMAAQLCVFFDYSLGLAHYLDLLRVTLKDLAGTPETNFLRLGEQAFHNGLAGEIYEEGRELIAVHRSLGHTVALITSATRAQAAPFARELNIEHLCCTELETADGRISGTFHPCYGESKRDAAEQFCAQRGLWLRHAWFYTDGIEDLPLLENVGHPVIANPKRALARIAAKRGWPHLVFAPSAKTTPKISWQALLASLRGSTILPNMPAWRTGRRRRPQRRSPR